MVLDPGGGVERHRNFAVRPACLSGDSGPLPFGVPFAEPYASSLPPLLPYRAGGPGRLLGVRSRSRLSPVHVPRPPVLAEARDRTIPTG